MTTYMGTPPNFSDISPASKLTYEEFYKQTYQDNLKKGIGSGASLDQLVQLAVRTRNVLMNGIPSKYKNRDEQVNWEMTHLSFLKFRLSLAIKAKSNYYDKHWFGKITQFFLKLFCMWNEGSTKAIENAEDFLLSYNFSVPVVKVTNPNDEKFGKYILREDFPYKEVHVKNIDYTALYNYRPKKPRPLYGNYVLAD